MIKKLKKYNFILGFLSLLTLLVIPFNVIYALPVGPGPGSQSTFGASPPHLTGLVGVFSALIGLMYTIVTLVLFIIVLVNGFKYLFSGVNPDLKDQARKGLTYAFVGLAVIVLAYFIILLVGSFVAPNFTNSFVSGSTLQFNLNIPTQK